MNSPIRFRYNIDKNIPLPPRSMSVQGKWAPVVNAMDAGDSISFPTMREAGCLQAALRNAKFKTSVRKQENGSFRVWKLDRRA